MAVEPKDPEYADLLLDAIKHGDVESLKQHIDNGLDIKQQYFFSQYGRWCTPLLVAIYHKQDACMELLLKSGSNPNRVDALGTTPLMAANMQNYKEGMELLLEYNAAPDCMVLDETVLIQAIRCNHLEIAKVLIRHGASVNASGFTKQTPLMEAIKLDQAGCVELLVSHGADIEAPDDLGETCLMRASQDGHHESLEILLKNNAQVDQADIMGMTALMKSVCHINCVELLLKFHADLLLVDFKQKSALIHAAVVGEFPVVKLLVSKGAEINGRDSNGLNAFMNVCMHKDPTKNMWKVFNEDVMVYLYAAGSTMDEGVVVVPPFLEYLRSFKNEKHLKHLCRDVITRKLIDCHPRTTLFNVVPQLGLPPSVASYMVYELTIT